MAVRDGMVCLAMVGKLLVVKGFRTVVSSRHGSSSRAGVRATFSLVILRMQMWKVLCMLLCVSLLWISFPFTGCSQWLILSPRSSLTSVCIAW